MNGLFTFFTKEAASFDNLYQKAEKGLSFLSRCKNTQNTIFISNGKTFLEPGNNTLGCIAMGTCGSNPKQFASIGNYRIIFHGKLFNYKEITQEIHIFHPDYNYNSDAEIALLFFIQKGTKAFADFDGYWSLIIADWDNQKIYAARDAFGNKPLYYCRTNTQFGISSETRPLFSVMDDAKNINKDAATQYLLWGDMSTHKQDFFADIHELNASHYIEYSFPTNSFEELPYYTLPYKDCKGGYNEYEEPYYVDKIRQLVLESVTDNIAGKNTVAIGLSGGLDSSSILCCAKKINPDLQITAFTSTDLYDGREAIWAEKTVKHTGVDWIKIFYSSQDMINQLDTMIKIQNVPIFNVSSFVRYKIMETAHQHGFDSIINGQGGNELLGGHRKYFPPFLRSLRSQWMLKHWLKEVLNLGNSDIRQKEIAVLWLKNIARKYYYNEKRLAQKTKSKELVFFNKQYLDSYFSKIYIPKSSKDVLNEYLYESYTSFLPQVLHWGEHFAASFQIDCLMPFSNSKKLAEYVFSVPSTFKIHNGWNKYLLRKAMTGIIPDEVLWRKQGFYISQKKWLTEIGKEIKKQIKKHDDIEQFIDKNSLLKEWDNLYLSENIQFQQFTFRYLSYLIWRNGLND